MILFWYHFDVMNIITRDTDYSIKILLYIINKGTTATVSELEKALTIPKAFLRKITQTLAKNNVLISSKGKNGGFRFPGKPEDIKLFDIVEIFQGDFKITTCMFKKKICPDTNCCALRKNLLYIQNKIADELKSITLKKLLHAE